MHWYGNVPVVANVLVAVMLAPFGTFAGAPAVVPKTTLCVEAPNVHVTLPPTAIVTEGVRKVNAPVPTAAVNAALAGPATTTVDVAVALVPSRESEAVIVVDPGAIAVTEPALFTIAVPAAAVVKVKPLADAIALPRASRADGCRAAVAPIASEGDAGESARVANFCATVKLTFAVADPLVAVIVTEPSVTAVTVAVVPLPLTVATAALLDVYEMVGLASAD